jgi:hypothetical protein
MLAASLSKDRGKILSNQDFPPGRMRGEEERRRILRTAIFENLISQNKTFYIQITPTPHLQPDCKFGA